MLKSTISQQVEIERTKEVSQQVKRDATSSSLERSASLEIIPKVTQDSDKVAEQDADDDEDQGTLWVMSMNPLQLEDPEEIHANQVGLHYRYNYGLCSPNCLRGDPVTYRKAEISSELKMWKDVIEEEMSSLHKK